MKIFKLALKYLLIIILAVYLFGAGYYYFHTYPKSVYGETKYGDLTKSELIEKLNKNETTDIELVEGDYKESIKGNDINYVNNFDSSSFDTKKNSLLWPVEVSKTIQLKGQIKTNGTYDEKLLKEKLLQTKLLTSVPRIPSQNAQVTFGTDKFVVKEEVYGNEFDKDKLVKAVLDNVKNNSNTIDVKKVDSYVKPTVFKDNKDLAKQAEYKNRWAGTNIILDLAGKKVPLIDKTTDNGFKTNTEEGFAENNEKRVESFVKELGEKYNTISNTRNFKTSNGDTVEILPGNFGFEIDEKELTALINDNLKQGNNTEIKVPFSNEGTNIEKDDFGNSYIEIDISTQSIWAYKDGQKIVDTRVVTGNYVKDPNRATPPGAWHILAKTTNQHLVSNTPGDTYDAFVNYWMMFTMEQHGLHDASWIETYGGEVYKERGSHGCVNLIYPIAAKLYENFPVGTPVIIYASGRAPSETVNIYDANFEAAPAEQHPNTSGDS